MSTMQAALLGDSHVDSHAAQQSEDWLWHLPSSIVRY